MTFWIIFICIILIFLAHKIYVVKGLYQGTAQNKVVLHYGAFSVLTLLIGLITMISAFSGGIIGVKQWQNFLIALMIIVIMAEGIMAFFFLLDDLWGFGKKITIPLRASTGKGRRKFLKQIGMWAGGISFLPFFYGITKGKYDFQVFRETLYFEDLPPAFDGFTIAQFSDLHSGSLDSIEAVRRGFDLLQEVGADMILFTGDLVNDLADEILPFKDMMNALEAPFGKYSVLGNHDYPQDEELFPTEADGQLNLKAIKQHHAEMGFSLMNNSNIKIEKDGEYFRLIGVENWGTLFIHEGDLDTATEGCEENEFSVLMSHDPTHWEEKVIDHPKHIHLTLSGHTHGSQLAIELMGIKWSPVQYFYKKWAGLYKEKGQYLYVNRGFGFVAFAGRIGVPPEITVFTLQRGEKV